MGASNSFYGAQWQLVWGQVTVCMGSSDSLHWVQWQLVWKLSYSCMGPRCSLCGVRWELIWGHRGTVHGGPVETCIYVSSDLDRQVRNIQLCIFILESNSNNHMTCSESAAVYSDMTSEAISWFLTQVTQWWLLRCAQKYTNINLFPGMNCSLEFCRFTCFCWAETVTGSTVINRLLVGCMGKVSATVKIYGYVWAVRESGKIVRQGSENRYRQQERISDFPATVVNKNVVLSPFVFLTLAVKEMLLKSDRKEWARSSLFSPNKNHAGEIKVILLINFVVSFTTDP
jgi:hypothetical protein